MNTAQLTASPPPCSSLHSLPGKGTPTFPQMGRRFKPGRPDGVFSLLAAVLYCTIPLVRHVRLSFSSPHGWHVLQQGPYCYFRLSLCVRQICARKVCFVSGSVIVKWFKTKNGIAYTDSFPSRLPRNHACSLNLCLYCYNHVDTLSQKHDQEIQPLTRYR